jgi:hypothetical protein
VSSNAPPAGPKRRRAWNPPSISTIFVHDEDGSVWRVYQLDRASRQVCLTASVDGHRKWVKADDLERNWTQVP